MSDLRLALRSLAARPAFALLVVLTLGLGIGANAAIFSAVHGLLLRPAPFKDPERLVRVTTVRGEEDGTVAVPEFDDLRALPVVESAALYTDQGMYNASGFGTPEELQATITTHDLFRVLGVEPLVGSTFPAAFDRTRNFGLVISHGLWMRKFGGDPGVVGRTMTLDGAPGYTIYGVMPRDFNFPSHSDLFRSNGISADPKTYMRRDLRDRIVVARLTAGVTVEQARRAVDTLARRLESEFPATNAGLRFRVTPVREMYTGVVRPYVLLLFGAVVLVLFVACANVANLLLSRAIARDREVAIRLALGATRWRVIRQMLTESLVLSVLATAVGGALAVWGVRALTALVPVPLPRWMQIQVDGRVWLFLALVGVVTGIAAGVVPALRSSSRALHGSLKEGSRGSSDGVQHGRLRNALVVAEVALSLVLLIGASLLIRSVWRLHQVDLGFQTARTLTFRVELGWRAYGTLEKYTTFHRSVLERVRQLPGVQAVTFDNNLPMSGKPRDPVAVRLVGQSPDEEARNPYVHPHLVGPDYFTTMGVPLLRGRGFDDNDRPQGLPVVVVSQRLADRLWPREDPIGQRIQQQSTGNTVWFTVVGIAGPTLQHELDGDPGFDMYWPFTQMGTAGPYYVIRTASDPMSIASAATAIIGETDPNQSFLDVQTYDRRIANRIWQRRVAGALFGGFAVLALVLAAVGLYGVLSYVVSQQTKEIGVRIALGASPRDVVRMVLGRGLRLAVIGVGVGLLLAFVLARVVAGMLFEISPADPITFSAIPALLLGIAAVACYVPARRAMGVDPIVALRAE
jgi:putative ABC transport system permease protein